MVTPPIPCRSFARSASYSTIARPADAGHGIDPGKRTGLAFYDAEAGVLTRCEALPFWDAVEAVRSAAAAPPGIAKRDLDELLDDVRAGDA